MVPKFSYGLVVGGVSLNGTFTPKPHIIAGPKTEMALNKGQLLREEYFKTLAEFY